jgi:GntR family transcriptional regulator
VSFEFSSSTPIYLQIMDLIRLAVITGAWHPGDKIASVRDLALEYGVNPNTVQRALSELEREGLLYAERTSGRFVTTDADLISRLRDTEADRQIDRFRQQMASLGFPTQDALRLLQQKWSDPDDHD